MSSAFQRVVDIARSLGHVQGGAAASVRGSALQSLQDVS